MVQIKALTTVLIASALVLPALAAPVYVQGSPDLALRDYPDHDLVQREIAFEPVFAREFGDEIDIEARDPRISNGAKRVFGKIGNFFKKAASFVLGRELDEAEDLAAREYDFEEDFD